MRKTDYSKLASSIQCDWRSALDEFAATPSNSKVYALAAQYHPQYGDPILAIGTEASFIQSVAKYPNQTTEELHRLGGVRWNPAEFEDFDIAPRSALTEELIDKFRQTVEAGTERQGASHAGKFSALLVEAVLSFSNLESLDRVPNFVAYVWPSDASDQELIHLARRTIAQPLFDSLFPEVRVTEEFMASLSHRPASEQAAFWCDALEGMILETTLEPARMLRSLGRTQYDAKDALVAVGPTAIPQLARLLEEHAVAEEWNERDSAEWKRVGAATKRGSLASSALLALMQFSSCPDDIVVRLLAVLRLVHARDRGRLRAGVNGQLIARTLHALRPETFPSAAFSASTNHLLNYESYDAPETLSG